MKVLVTAVLLIVLALTARIVKQYEQVLFRLGRVIGVRPATRASRPRTSLSYLLIHVNRRNVSSMASRAGETGALKVLLHR